MARPVPRQMLRGMFAEQIYVAERKGFFTQSGATFKQTVKMNGELFSLQEQIRREFGMYAYHFRGKSTPETSGPQVILCKPIKTAKTSSMNRDARRQSP